ncbi:MAG: hypothetical protein IJ111_13315 [Eggerthellaceae bacterium]|nr:hypothetical protein [Eggerthellaceae bacterium]
MHKRRVNRKSRSEKAADQPIGEPAREPEPQNPEPQTPAAEPAEGVVLKPEFGRRTEAQHEADDRWFAAMREDVPEVIPTSSEASSEQVSAELQAAVPAETGEQTPVGTRFIAPAEQGDATGEGAQQEPASQPTEEIPQLASDEAEGESEGEAAPAAAGPPARFGAKAAGAFAAREKLSVKRRILLILTAVIVVAIAVAVALFTWNRWYRFDDHADMQGEWYVVGTTVPVSIDESSIHLTDDVTYQYEINPQDKTIRYTFGPMEGQGRYWFSDDRRYLVITDGDDFTSTGTAFDDLLHSFGDMADAMTGSNMKLPEGEGIIAFSREPDAHALAREQEEAAKKAAAEEAARKEEERRAAEEAAAEAAELEEYYEEDYYEEAPADEGQSAEESSGDEGNQEE